MKPAFFSKSLLVIAVSAFSILTLAAWQDRTLPKAPKAPPAPAKIHDTIPAKPTKPRNIDEVMQELDKAALNLDKELQKPVQPVAPPAIDGDKIKADMEKSLKDMEASKVQMESEMAVAKVDWEKMKKELEKIKEIDFKKINAEIANSKIDIEKSLKEAKVSIEKAKAEMKEYKAFLADLEKDGLINTNSNYKVEIGNGKLTIDGKEQPESVNAKYKSFIDKHDGVYIKKDADSFDIHRH